MARFVFSLLFLLVWSGRLTAATIDHVIHISVDGLRGDLLSSLVAADVVGDYDNFARFVSEGATTYNARADYFYTDTLPNHTTMLTARPTLQPAGQPNTVYHGYTDNGTPDPSWTLHNHGNPNLSYVASSFDVAHDNGLSTALFTSKDKFIIFEQSYNALAGAPDTTPPDDGPDKIDTYLYQSTGSPSNSSNLHASFLSSMSANHYNYAFLHYREPDSAGHTYGWGSSTWNLWVHYVDDYLADVFELVENDPTLVGHTAIILSADHGGSGTSHSNASLPADYTIPFFVWGPGVAAGADLYLLNLENRLDPGGGRPDYNAPLQPIRNGDGANLALDLLSLPAVPGSFINPGQDLLVDFNPADTDHDYDVDTNDLVTMFQNFTGAVGAAGGKTSAQGDTDADGDVDTADITLGFQHYTGAYDGMLPTSPGSGPRPVPEPGGLVLAGAGIALLIVWRTRGRMTES